MKGSISLKSFIEEVKAELRESINEDDPFFVMRDVELEVSFALDAEAKAGAKLFVIDVGGSTKATQTHKVKLTLSPFIETSVPEERVEDKQTSFRARLPALKANEQSKSNSRAVQPVIFNPVKQPPARHRGKVPHRTQPVCHDDKSNRTFIAPKDDKKI